VVAEDEMPDPQTDAERRAAALEALRAGQPASSPAATFWQQHGGKVIFAVALVLGIWLFARVVGSFVKTSIAETHRTQEEVRRGLAH
jgi:hypothetical protein